MRGTVANGVNPAWGEPTFLFDVGDISFIHFSFISSGFGGHFRKFLCFGSSLVSSGGDISGNFLDISGSSLVRLFGLASVRVH